MIRSGGAPMDRGAALAAIRAQAAMVRTNAFELEQLGLTLSGRDLSTVSQADLVSYLVWISLLTSHTARVLATWGVGLVAYLDSAASSMESPESAAGSAGTVRRSAGAPRRWRGRS